MKDFCKQKKMSAFHTLFTMIHKYCGTRAAHERATLNCARNSNSPAQTNMNAKGKNHLNRKIYYKDANYIYSWCC